MDGLKKSFTIGVPSTYIVHYHIGLVSSSAWQSIAAVKCAPESAAQLEIFCRTL